MATQPKPYVTPDEYLALEREAAWKNEYYQGEVFAMSGAGRKHNLLTTTTIALLYAQLRKGPCEMYSGDMRVKVSPTGLYTYPDVVVVCGEPVFEDASVDTLLNPSVIIEVLSPSTEAYDRGAKFGPYRTLESLTDYLLIAQDHPLIEHYARQPDNRWLLSEFKHPEDSVPIASIACELSMADVYEKVDFEE